jgi:hypothetical protein
MSGGSLMSSVKDGIGSLFGADSPVDKLKVFIGELSNLDITPLLSTAFAFDLLLTSSDRLQEFGTNLAVISMYTEPFVEQMDNLSLSLMIMGKDPFAPFNTLGTHAEGMTMFATSTEQLTAALDNIDYAYISDGFYDVADSIEAVADSMSQISMGDMLKMGAMKLLGPSKQERAATEKQEAVKSVAFDKLHGDDMMSGLTGLMDKLTQSAGKTAYAPGTDMLSQVMTRQGELSAAGVDVDSDALLSGDSAKIGTALQDVTRQLQSQIDMYKMQNSTGVVADNVPTTAQAVAEELVATPGKISPNSPTADKKKLEEAIGGDMTQSELLTELVRLTQLNNNLLKKGNKITAEIEV